MCGHYTRSLELLKNEEVEEKIRNGDFSNIVAERDGKKGCPEIIWDGPYNWRCGLGINKCARHGYFLVKYKD